MSNDTGTKSMAVAVLAAAMTLIAPTAGASAVPAHKPAVSAPATVTTGLVPERPTTTDGWFCNLFWVFCP